MKLFYTRKEMEEEISRRILEREREQYAERRYDSLITDFLKLEERVSKIEFEMNHFQVSKGTGTVQPEFCNCKVEKNK